LALERILSNCEEKEKKAPVLSVVYLLNGSQLLGEAALGQHRQQEVYQAPHNITIIIRKLEGGDTQQKALIKKDVDAVTTLCSVEWYASCLFCCLEVRYQRVVKE
jgi:hypothetical protein